jgi:hypothetical protein
MECEAALNGRAYFTCRWTYPTNDPGKPNSSTQPSPFPWLTPIQALQREQDLTGLAPEGGLITTKPVERTCGKVGQANIRAREIIKLACRIIGRRETNLMQVLTLARVNSARNGVSVHAIDNLLALLMTLSSSLKL